MKLTLTRHTGVMKFSLHQPGDLHAQKMQALGQLAGGVAHDFNNILSIIEGYARMLARQNHGGGDAAEKLQQILMATKRGAGLTRQLLAFGRQQILPLAQCDLAALVRETSVLLRPLLTRRIQLEIGTPDAPVVIPCDPDLVTQILINLTVNARDAIVESGMIRIDVTQSHDCVLLIVTDNGRGMDEATASRIFDPFFTTKDVDKGTGLGLAMIAGTMQQLGGDITVDTAPGFGTTFTLTFPLQLSRPVASSQPALSIAPSPPSLQQKTILVVDDEDVMLPVLDFQLREMGMKVLQASNADSALVLQANYPDTIHLLLTDVVMPGVSGVRLAELMARHRPETGVVFMSGFPNRADMPGLSSPLPDDALLVPKPLQSDELSPALQAALRRVAEMQDDE